MRALLLRLERATTGLAMLGACAMLAAAAGLGMWQIVTRFVIQEPAEWTEVLIRFTLIWMVFLGVPHAFRFGAMVSVDALQRVSGPRVARALHALALLASLALVALIIVVGWDYARRGAVQSIAGLEGISMFWAYLALPVGGAFSALALLGNWLDPQRTELENAT